jgi:hypothetical protein
MSAGLARRQSAAAPSTTTWRKIANPSRTKAPSRMVMVCLNCVASARKARTRLTNATLVVELRGMRRAWRKTTIAPASSQSSGEKARRFPKVFIRCLATAG